MPKKQAPTGFETLPPWLWPNYSQTTSPTSVPTFNAPAYTGGTPNAPALPATPPGYSLSVPGVTPGPWATGYTMPPNAVTFKPQQTAPIYNAPASVGGGGGTGGVNFGIPWAGNQQGQAAQVARWQQAVSGYTNSAGTQIPGIPGMSFLDWYYQLGGRIVPGMSQQEANYIAAREAPYARLRARIAAADRGRARRVERRQEEQQTAETIPAETARYAPPTTNWRIG